MACPYFCPTRRLEASEWRSRIRPPLGDAYEGECHANGSAPHQPPRDLMLEGCNLGYASQQCGHFPAGAAAEAIRFCVRSDSGAEVRIDYVLERAHLPGANGVIVYDRRLECWQGIETGSLMQRQVQAYLDSYLAWKVNGAPRGVVAEPPAKRAAAGGKR